MKTKIRSMTGRRGRRLGAWGLVVMMGVLVVLPACQRASASGSTSGVTTRDSQYGPINDPNPGPGLKLAPNPKVVVPIHRTPAQWHKVLSKYQFYILRDKGTEPPKHNPYDENWKPGVYACAGCGLVLFSSKAKYEAHTGWPSFYEAIAKGRVKLVPNRWGGTEVECARCGGHLGDLFHDGPKPTGLRYCMDSAALKFIPAKSNNDQSKPTK